jgi:hypothetical protein
MDHKTKLHEAFSNAISKKPHSLKEKVDEIMREKVKELIDEVKEDVAQTWFDGPVDETMDEDDEDKQIDELWGMGNIRRKISRSIDKASGSQQVRLHKKAGEKRQDAEELESMHAKNTAMWLDNHGRRYKGDKSHTDVGFRQEVGAKDTDSPEEVYSKHDKKTLQRAKDEARKSKDARSSSIRNYGRQRRAQFKKDVFDRPYTQYLSGGKKKTSTVGAKKDDWGESYNPEGNE